MAVKTTLLGRGIYDTTELARLVQRSPKEVSGWAVPTDNGDALLRPHKGRLFTFYDLVTAKVTAELRSRGVPLPAVRDARHHLASLLEVEWPLAHAHGLDRLATAGGSVYYDHDGADNWVDASRGGQTPFMEVAAPLIRRLEFDAHGMASAWHPADVVSINPGVQAGAPCVAGTRVSTALLAALSRAGEDDEDIAADYDLDPNVVRDAIYYENSLAA